MTRPTQPNLEGLSAEAAAKANADYQTANDAYLSGIMAKSPGQISPEEVKDLGEALGAWNRAGRP